MINQQIDFSKKAKISKGIKVLLPAGLFFGGGGYGAFYLTKQLQSSDQALSTSHLANFDNFHSLFSPNSYSSWKTAKNSHSSFQTLKEPKWDKKQSFDLNSFVSLNPHPTQNLAVQSKNAPDWKTQAVFSTTMTQDDFDFQFHNRLSPSLNFAFDLKIAQTGNGIVKPKTDLITNKAFGFDLDDFITSKKREYQVFSYDVNNNFSQLTGNIQGVLETEIKVSNVLAINLKLRHKITSHDPNYQADTQQLALTFTFPKGKGSVKNNLVPFTPFILWDNYGRNSYNKWLWTLPEGPKTKNEIKNPVENGSLVKANYYTITPKQPPKSLSAWFKFPYTKLDNFSKTTIDNTYCHGAKSTGCVANEVREEDLYKVHILKNQIQNIYPTTAGKPNNQLLKVQFDLESDVMEATYGQRQKYITTVHGIFNKNAIINGNDYEQELVNYDLQKGRANNGGKFKLKMKVSHQLDNSLVITIGAVADRFYFQKPANLTKKDNDFDFKYKLKNLKLITYSNVKNNLPQSNPIAPQNSFGHQRKFVANSVVFTSDIDINSPNGKLHSRTVSQPYLITMEPKTSSFQEIDLQYLYQKGNPESSKVFLTFHFQPVFQVGTFGIYTNDRDPKIYNFLIWNYQPDTQSKGYNRYTLARNVAGYDNLNIFNYYSLSLSDIITPMNHGKQVIYTWLNAYSYRLDDLEKHGKISQKESGNWHANIFEWGDPTYDGGSSFTSLARVKYKIHLDFNRRTKKLKYALKMESWGFQWYKNKSFSAGVGRAGFGLNAIDVTVKN